MAFKKYSRKGSRKGKKRTYKRKSYAKKVSPMKKLIRKEISRNVENKTVQIFNFDRTLGDVTEPNFDSSNVFALGPDPSSILINQGTGQGGRIGNRIRTKKLTLKGVFTPTFYHATYNTQPTPQQIKIFIFYDKTDPNALPAPVNSADFFQNGNSARSFAGDVTDMMMPVNEDRYRVLTTRTYKLGYAAYTGSPGAAQPAGYFSNNDFKLNCNFSIDLTKYYPKDVRFPDNSALPTTRGLYCMVVCSPANGLGSAAQRPVTMQYVQDYHFEDA
ncbi:MAG: capsid protein [Wigfec virus K19_555]|nr:MAG: capsid protein [Wigfec virus K19_555]